MGFFKNLFKPRPGGSGFRRLLTKIPGVGDIFQAIPENKRGQAKTMQKEIAAGKYKVPIVETPTAKKGGPTLDGEPIDLDQKNTGIGGMINNLFAPKKIGGGFFSSTGAKVIMIGVGFYLFRKPIMKMIGGKKSKW